MLPPPRQPRRWLRAEYDPRRFEPALDFGLANSPGMVEAITAAGITRQQLRWFVRGTMLALRQSAPWGNMERTGSGETYTRP